MSLFDYFSYLKGLLKCGCVIHECFLFYPRRKLTGSLCINDLQRWCFLVNRGVLYVIGGEICFFWIGFFVFWS